ncbi:MAG: hypothetical protein ACLP7A_03835 [Desulfobaccales bacterium]
MKDNELRGVILEKFYEKRRDRFFAPIPKDFDPPIASEDLYRISDQLGQHSLIKFDPINGMEGIIAVGRITAYGVDIVEGAGSGSPISIVITQNIFNQSFMFDIEQIILKINDIDASPEDKIEAKSRLKAFIEHPLVTSIFGGILGNLPSLLK